MRFLRMLWKCLTVWKVPPALDADIRKARNPALFAFSDSKMRDGSAGEGNELIAQTAVRYQRLYGMVVMAQEEVADAAKKVASDFVLRYAAIGPQHGKSERGWNTAVIADLFVEHGAQEHDLVIVATVPDHMPRCIWVTERRGLTAGAARMPKGRYFHPGLALWSCRGGTWRFRARDFLVRIFFLIRGEI